MQLTSEQPPGDVDRGPVGRGEAPRPRTTREAARRIALGEGRRWLSEPRSAVLIVLGGVVVLGGGWKLFNALKARRTIARLGESDVSPAEIEASVSGGRAALPDLFRLLGEAPTAEHRTAAIRAIATLWSRDELVAEEEQALVRRAFSATWRARRRYPRALKTEIPIRVSYGAGLATMEGRGIAPANLEWSHRIIGTRRAALESYSDWQGGEGHCEFAIVPGDFDGVGPHRLALQPRVRTQGLTGSWQIELPAVPFSFELDPRLEVSSLLTQPDAGREQELRQVVRLERPPADSEQIARFLPLNSTFAIRNPPALVVTTPLSCDLAFRSFVEFEGVNGRFVSGTLVLGGQGSARPDDRPATNDRWLPIELPAQIPATAIERPGPCRMRIVLETEPQLGWIDPDVRSIWPGTLETPWIDADIVRI